MAVLSPSDPDRQCRLPLRAIVGRSSSCDLHIRDPRCSSQHAEILWMDGRWVVRDLSSRNGTWVDGLRMPPRAQRDLRVGQRLAFGHPPDQWEVLLLPPAVACARAPDGRWVFAQDGVLVVGPADRPAAVLDVDRDGRWWIEREGRRDPCPPELEVSAEKQIWRVMAPRHDPATTELQHLQPTLAGAHLTVHISPDEEHVLLDTLSIGVRTRLESRAHGYLLAILARRRLSDRQQGASPDDEGWMSLEGELAPALGVSVQDVNVQVFRARKQFTDQGIDGVEHLVERRAGELRLGLSALHVVRHLDWPPPTDPSVD